MSDRRPLLSGIAIPLSLIFTTFSIGLFALWTGTGASKKSMPLPIIAFLFLMVATPAMSLLLAIRGHTKEMLWVLGIGGTGLIGMVGWAYLALLHA